MLTRTDMEVLKRMPPLQTVRKNVIANFAGKTWTSIVSLVFVPVYLKYLGIEAYGLIGLYLSLTALLSVLDMGLSTTLSRELARLSAAPAGEQEARDLVRTMEMIYWGIGILLALATFLLAPLIARYWVNPKGVTVETVHMVVMIMGFLIASDWPVALYSGGLTGLQHQVQLNLLRSVSATVQAVGGVLVLWLISSTVIAFFLWQIVVSIAQTATLALCLWSNLPKTDRRPVFRRELLKKNVHFTAGMSAISVLVMLLTQTDKIILSRLLSLESFGYYILAFNVANTLNHIGNPIFTALFPKFAQLSMDRKESDLAALYHSGSQLLALVVLPVAVTLGVFAPEILSLWIRNPVTVENTQLLLRILLVGTMFNTLMTLPYAAQIASGWTRLSLGKNVVAVCIVIPALILLTPLYGAVAAASVWIALNLGYYLIEVPLMHRRILPGEMASWYLKDSALPLIMSFGVGLLSRSFMPAELTEIEVLLWISGTLVVTTVVATLPMSRIRIMIKEVWGIWSLERTS